MWMTSSIRHGGESQLDVSVKSRKRVAQSDNIIVFSFVLKLLTDKHRRKKKLRSYHVMCWYEITVAAENVAFVTNN